VCAELWLWLQINAWIPGFYDEAKLIRACGESLVA
jgi:hypothetical protein